MSFLPSLGKGLLLASGAAVAGHIFLTISRTKPRKNDSMVAASGTDGKLVLEASELIKMAPSNVLVTGAHLAGGGILLGMAVGSWNSPQHITSIAKFRAAVLASLPITGVLSIISNIKSEKDVGFDMKKTRKADSVTTRSEMAHTVLFLAIAATEVFYNRDDPESNKKLIAVSAVLVAANVLVGKMCVRGHTLKYVSGVRKLHKQVQNGAK